MESNHTADRTSVVAVATLEIPGSICLNKATHVVLKMSKQHEVRQDFTVTRTPCSMTLNINQAQWDNMVNVKSQKDGYFPSTSALRMLRMTGPQWVQFTQRNPEKAVQVHMMDLFLDRLNYHQIKFSSDRDVLEAVKLHKT